MKGRKLRGWAWALVLLIGAALSCAYFLAWLPLRQGSMDKDLFERQIGSPLLLWMNGYLGPFLHLDYQGILNWLALPVLLWWSVRPPGGDRRYRAVGILVIISAGVIGAFGGFNPRYGFTLYPVVLAVVFLGAWRLMMYWEVPPRRRMVVLASLVALQYFNVSMDVLYRVRAWRIEKMEAARTAPQGIGNASGKTLGVQEWLDQAGIGASTTVLVNNLPQFWYGAARKGLYYWSGSDLLYGAQGPELLLERRTEDEAAHFLADSLGCRYVLTTGDLSGYGERFRPFLEDRCSLVALGPQNLQLFRIRDLPSPEGHESADR